jgi:hypothetical protein
MSMLNHLPNGKLHFVEGWLPEHDPEVVVLIWQIRSIIPGIECSEFAAEVVFNTYLIETLHADSLEGIRSILHEQYGPAQESDGHGVFAHAAELHHDELVHA